VSNSMTRPRTRGCWRTMLMLMTTSRTGPATRRRGPAPPAREPGRVHPVDRRHGSKGRSGRVNSAYRPRRTCLSVPAAIEDDRQGQGLPADEVFLDLEDAVAVDAKAAARTTVASGAGRAGLGRSHSRVFASTTGPRPGRTPI
jgi:hypothetical protein